MNATEIRNEEFSPCEHGVNVITAMIWYLEHIFMYSVHGNKY